MVLIEKNSNLDINNIMERLNRNIQTFNKTTSKQWKIAYSCGVLFFDPKNKMNHQQFYKKIDEQLYIDKKKNREK